MILLVPIAGRGALVATVAFGLGQAMAQQPISLPQAVEAAWQRAAESTATLGSLHRAQAESATVSAYWAAPPALEIAQRTDRGLTGNGARETEIGLAVPLWLPGQRLARRQVVTADIDVARLQRETARLVIAGRVRTAQSEIHLRRVELDLARAEAASLEELSRDVDRRVAAGDLARADALAAQAEWLAALARSAQAGEQETQARLRWRSLTGLDEVPELEAAPHRAQGTESEIESHPALREARARIEASNLKIGLVQSSRRSTPELVARMRQDAGGRGAAAVNSLGVALRIPFDTEGRNEPLRVAAQAERELAQAQERQLETQLAAAIQAQRLSLTSIDSQLAGEQKRALLLRERASLIALSFKAGETALPEMLRSLAAASSAEASARRLQVQRGQATARLRQALGILP